MTELIILPDPPVVKWHEEDTDPDCLSIIIDWSEFTRSVLAFRRSNPRCLEILKQLHAITGQVIQDIQEVNCGPTD